MRTGADAVPRNELYQTFSTEVADFAPVVKRALTTEHGDIHDLIYRIYEESKSGPASLDGDARANYDAARANYEAARANYEAAQARVLAARQTQQDQIKPARR